MSAPRRSRLLPPGVHVPLEACGVLDELIGDRIWEAHARSAEAGEVLRDIRRAAEIHRLSLSASRQRLAAPGPEPRRLLSTEQAAERLGITARTVCRLIERGELPAAKLGRGWLIDETDLELHERAEIAKAKETG